MVGFRPGIARRRWLPGRVASLVITIGLLAAACGPVQTAATGAATAHGTAEPSPSARLYPACSGGGTDQVRAATSLPVAAGAGRERFAAA